MFKKAMVLGALLFSCLVVGQAAAKDLVLFECKFEEGGKVKVTRDSHDVKMVITNADKSKQVISSPLDESGVGTQIAVDGSSADFLDLLEGDMQYSVAYAHQKISNFALFTIISDTGVQRESYCLATTVTNNLADPATIAGIFKP